MKQEIFSAQATVHQSQFGKKNRYQPAEDLPNDADEGREFGAHIGTGVVGTAVAGNTTQPPPTARMCFCPARLIDATVEPKCVLF